MAVGQVVCSLYHMGTLVNMLGTTFALLNGQSVSRSSYPSISSVWPSGSYASDTTTIVLPDTNTLGLRGASLGSNNDPDNLLRVALAGTAPSGVAVGSYQSTNVKSHAHVSGSQNVFADAGSGYNPVDNDGVFDLGAITTTSAIVSGTSLSVNRPMEFNKAGVEFDVDHTIVYYYIALV